MPPHQTASQDRVPRQESAAPSLPHRLLAPLPLALMQPLLKAIVTQVAESHPDLFARLGANAGKRFRIDPVNLPLVLLLWPDPQDPELRAYARGTEPVCDASISGAFLNLFDMIDGRLDGDALFFSRDLHIDGDTEAVVALRNALDNLDTGTVESVSAAFGPLSKPVSFAFAALRRIRGQN